MLRKYFTLKAEVNVNHTVLIVKPFFYLIYKIGNIRIFF